MYRRVIKRVLDTILAALGLIVFSIPMIIIALIIKLDSEGPVIFKQEREGKNRKRFNVYKFRTMCNNAYEMGGIVTNAHDSRITKVGAFLRRSSLDELPQFINIIKGDMAIIGPRPILDWEFEQYSDNEEFCKRFDVLPGMFCTVDVDYRAEADRELQFKMDVEYSENVNFAEDVRVFFGILRTVFSGKNVYKEDGHSQKED